MTAPALSFPAGRVLRFLQAWPLEPLPFSRGLVRPLAADDDELERALEQLLAAGLIYALDEAHFALAPRGEAAMASVPEGAVVAA